MQYLTKCIPATIVKGVKARDFYYRGLTEDKADLAGENLSNLIAYQTKQGWSLHSIEEITVRVKRKRFLKEWILGWIPILGAWLCPLLQEVNLGMLYPCYNVSFVREG